MIKLKQDIIASHEARKMLYSFTSVDDIKKADLKKCFEVVPEETTNRILSLIERKRDKLLSGSIEIDGKKYQINEKAQAAASFFLSSGGPAEWRTEENEILSFSEEEFKIIAMKIFSESQKIYKKSWEAKDAARLAKDENELFAAIKKMID